MNIVITGGAGFLGAMLTQTLLRRFPDITSLKVVDRVVLAESAQTDRRIVSVVADITNPADVEGLIDTETTHVFHLAAIVSSHAEEDFDLGVKVNLTATQLLLEKCRQANPAIRFVFSSSLAVFGGQLPAVIEPMTATQPSSSYGTQKAMCELLVNDYGRRGLVDAISVRLPTICIRPGTPNKAASSFVSGIIREPLKGEGANCPVRQDLPLWISSPGTVIDNIVHASQLSAEHITGFRTFNLPGIQVTPATMLAALADVAGPQRLALVSNETDPAVERIVASWPQAFDNDKERALGFQADRDFPTILASYLSQYPIAEQEAV
ncbi:MULTISPECIES: D-erythronate dehydrogenase [unclassified Vibrio]|uniref:D-erythronate dehydrogenase n=1 Tax=unclassified Vibrio TaxID=2614977 RepID=UPI001360DACF|nr:MULTISPECIES: D-erythronate dehydrogenase [unclassified Vibrio]NAW59992.1 NAD-dependent epimerase/dehydratase family protein [Vibrio sp. V36_P2S2PM302]NAX25526.1 NAD-dependent epimerase/dehydratase family protein [Vibrio sp. V38_P2S17PM301]NAX32326.1 NAD-dependent epimerase/dehydratase family protein [Vibrio sp. V37_P2S8PM304]